MLHFEVYDIDEGALNSDERLPVNLVRSPRNLVAYTIVDDSADVEAQGD
jgi:hypothetical protein